MSLHDPLSLLQCKKCLSYKPSTADFFTTYKIKSGELRICSSCKECVFKRRSLLIKTNPPLAESVRISDKKKIQKYRQDRDSGIVTTPDIKKCGRCLIEKPTQEFSRNNNTKDGLDYICRVCHGDSRVPPSEEERMERRVKDRLKYRNKVGGALKSELKPKPKDGHKFCGKCKLEKKLEDFNKNKYEKSGLQKICRPCNSLRNKSYEERNKEKIAIRRHNHRKNNPEKMQLQRLNRIDKIIETGKAYYKNNKRKILDRVNAYEQKRVKNDPCYAILKLLRSRLHTALKGKDKKQRTMELAGCDLEFLKKHLEGLFQDGMTWENRGRGGWHIDHIMPCSSFDFNKLEDQQKCFHYSNLQPLWEEENMKKSDKISMEYKNIVDLGWGI